MHLPGLPAQAALRSRVLSRVAAVKLILQHPHTAVVLEDYGAHLGDTRWRARLKGRSSGGYDTGFGSTAAEALTNLRTVYQTRLDDVDAAIAELPQQLASARRTRR